jgi:molybdenum cofactor sulfurtransferase
VLRRDFASKLVKHTYTENSVNLSLDIETFGDVTNFLEDDPPSRENAIAILEGLSAFEAIGVRNVQAHVWRLTRKLYEGIDHLTHSSGAKAAEIYGNHHLNNSDVQGGIVAFNVKNMKGGYVGYAEVVRRASQDQFHLRGGCHCNPGACFSAMRLSEEKVQMYFENKTTCGDNNDIVDGVPLGSVRASLGWATIDADIDSFMNWLDEVFIV